MVVKMHGFNDIFLMATQAIGQDYFNLPVFGGTNVLHERHYCYELYHQLRLKWPQDEAKILSGEIDKAAHHHMRDLIGSEPIPDFLIHIPGTMTNDTVIEVKSATFSHRGVKKDLFNLSRFILDAGYERAIFLLFGPDLTLDLIERVIKNYDILLEEGVTLGKIELWVHPNCGEKALHYCTLVQL